MLSIDLYVKYRDLILMVRFLSEGGGLFLKSFFVVLTLSYCIYNLTYEKTFN